eukprot:TRINITY_DN17622_c0_g1_i1.p1 TRINITY_DN17622_c0_g1~~TRINITY_DN17622_c0_g1_i1.p1  ORF type:complete len:306 (-),score=48.23 TRINITY_DN17622_c0_g1_i1:39-956(-)
MTKHQHFDPYSSQQYIKNTNLKIESELSIQQSPSPGSSPSPVSCPSSPVDLSTSSATISEITEDIVPKLPLDHLSRLLKELMEMIEKQKTQNIPHEFVDMVITELSSFSSTKGVVKKGIAKKKRERGNMRVCSKCGTNSTPEWRRSPEGSTTLCNACGLKEKKRAKNSSTTSNYGHNKFHHSTYASPPVNNVNTNPTVVAGRMTPPSSDYNYSYSPSSAPLRAHPYHRSQDASLNYTRTIQPSPIIPSYYPGTDEFAQQPYFFQVNGVAPTHINQNFGESSDCSHPNCPHCLVNRYSVMSAVYQQ